jgi:hypothetical protein
MPIILLSSQDEHRLEYRMQLTRPKRGIHVQLVDKTRSPSRSKTFSVYNTTLDEAERVAKEAFERYSERGEPRRRKQSAGV